MTEQLLESVRAKYGAVAESTLSNDHAGVQAVDEAFGYTAEELTSIPVHHRPDSASGRFRRLRHLQLRSRQYRHIAEDAARTGECDAWLEVDLELFVSCDEAAEVFEPREASFDAVALFVQGFVVSALLVAVAFGRDHRERAHAGDMLHDRIAVVALIRPALLRLACSQQGDGLGAVVDLPGGHGEVHRQAQLIGEQMDFDRQTSSGTPQSLFVPPFLRPVAACW